LPFRTAREAVALVIPDRVRDMMLVATEHGVALVRASAAAAYLRNRGLAVTAPGIAAVAVDVSPALACRVVDKIAASKLGMTNVGGRALAGLGDLEPERFGLA
jgi:hypothetical protein